MKKQTSEIIILTLFKTQEFSWQNNMSTTRLMSTSKPIQKEVLKQKNVFSFQEKTRTS